MLSLTPFASYLSDPIANSAQSLLLERDNTVSRSAATELEASSATLAAQTPVSLSVQQDGVKQYNNNPL